MLKLCARWSLAGLLPLLALSQPVEAAGMGFWLLMRPPIATIAPGASYNGTEGSGFGGSPPTASTTQFGAQSISSIASDGGLIQLTVPSTANMSDNEFWAVTGTGTSDGLWRLHPIDAIHVDLCKTLTGDVFGGYTCSGSTYSPGYVSGGSVGLPFNAIGVFDEPQFTWVEDRNHTVSIAAGSNSRANIASVQFCLEGNCGTPVTQPIINPRTTTQGWAVTPINSATCTSGGANVGIADLYAIITPVNGYQIVDKLPLVLACPDKGYVRPQRYVDKGAGSDTSGTGLSLGAAWATLAKAEGSSPSGAVINVNAQTWSCTIANGTPAIVTCPSNTLQPGATVQVSGSLPGGLAANTRYYVLPDPPGYVAGSSFELSTLVPGYNVANTNAPKNGFYPGTPINTTGANGSISVIGSVYVEGTGANNGVTLPITVQPVIPGTVTISVPTSNTNYKSATNRIAYSNMTFDADKIVQLTASTLPLPQTVNLQSSRWIDFNGDAPPYGHPSRGFGPFPNDATTYHAGSTENVFSAYTPAAPCVDRNSTGYFSYDAVDVGVSTTPGSFNNCGIFNKHMVKRGSWISPSYTATNVSDVKISAVSAYNSGANTTTLTLTGYTTLSVPQSGDGRLTFYSGALNGQRFREYSTNASTGVVVVFGDASGAGVGDTVYHGAEGHADVFQEVAATSTGTWSQPPLTNFVVQRYWVERDYKASDSNGYVADGLQGLLAQPGFNAVTGNALTASGLNVSIANALTATVSPGDVLSVGLSANKGTGTGSTGNTIAARIASVTDQTHFVLAYPFPTDDGTGNVSVSTWAQGKTLKDILFQNSMMYQADGEGFRFEGSQVNWVYQNDTLQGYQASTALGLYVVSSNPGHYDEGLSFFDTIMPNFKTANGLVPYGITADNSQSLNEPILIGTNMLSQAITFNLTTYSPVSGIKTLRRPPALPFDYFGSPRTILNSIGAVN